MVVPQRPGQATNLRSMGYSPPPEYGWKYSTKLYGRVVSNLSVLQQVSALTGLPVEIVATLLLSTVVKPKVDELVTVSDKFIHRARQAGLDATRLDLPGVYDAFAAFGESRPVRDIPPADLALTMASSRRM